MNDISNVKVYLKTRSGNVNIDECTVVKEANDANPLSQESKLTRVNLQLNLCPSKSTTPVLKRILFQFLKVNLQP